MNDKTSRPDGSGPGPGSRAADRATVGELLAAAVRPSAPDAAAERRAVDAFCAARDSGVSHARTRRRDDWRPRRRRRVWSARTAVGAVLASLTVGGVAMAAIGGSGGFGGSGGADGRPGTPRPGSSASAGE
ncbi:hypothetical protein OFY01_04240, partial [Streptomyces sp. GXMU-J5]|nr:hypothetical protein [Streptomyces beihaiensis]